MSAATATVAEQCRLHVAAVFARATSERGNRSAKARSAVCPLGCSDDASSLRSHGGVAVRSRECARPTQMSAWSWITLGAGAVVRCCECGWRQGRSGGGGGERADEAGHGARGRSRRVRRCRSSGCWRRRWHGLLPECGLRDTSHTSGREVPPLTPKHAHCQCCRGAGLGSQWCGVGQSGDTRVWMRRCGGVARVTASVALSLLCAHPPPLDQRIRRSAETLPKVRPKRLGPSQARTTTNEQPHTRWGQRNYRDDVWEGGAKAENGQCATTRRAAARAASPTKVKFARAGGSGVRVVE